MSDQDVKNLRATIAGNLWATTLLDRILKERVEANERIEELNRIKARTWTAYEMAEAQWTFTVRIHRDDTEEQLVHELAHVVQRFRHGADDPAHSERHAELTERLGAALAPPTPRTKGEGNE